MVKKTDSIAPLTPNLALARALAYLQSELVNKPHEPGSRLPTVRSLARAAGVATVTLSEALAQFEKRGIVHRIAKRGLFYQRPPEQPKRMSTAEKWETVAARLERDILAGHFRPGTALPQQRELQEHYGVAYPTLRKALEILARKGVLFSYKRSFRVAPSRKVTGDATLICIGLGDETGRLQIQNPRFQEFVFSLQNAAAINQIRLSLIGHHPRQGLASLFERIETLRAQHVCIGFVLWNTHVPLPAFLKTLAHVKAFGQPVAIMDEKSNLDGELPLLKEGVVRCFTLAGISAGRQIARYLLGMGHRKVAYLSCYHGESWSQRRWQGVEEVFNTAGLAGNAHLLAIDAGDTLWEPNDSPAALRTMYDHFRIFLADVRSATKTYPASHQLLYLQQNNEKLMRDLRMAIQIGPLLDRLAKDKTITACIAANDDMALAGMEYLQRIGMVIPGRISLIGVDDSLRATHFGLTSYNFNFPLIAQRIVAFIRNPQLREFVGKPVLECEGLIVERDSTAAT
jgi:DNA-binding LacI/PurR family transcriptional regulator/DNA-binding transcriptional regulator YhcF (GntR family)